MVPAAGDILGLAYEPPGWRCGDRPDWRPRVGPLVATRPEAGRRGAEPEHVRRHYPYQDRGHECDQQDGCHHDHAGHGCAHGVYAHCGDDRLDLGPRSIDRVGEREGCRGEHMVAPGLDCPPCRPDRGFPLLAGQSGP
jgi:hypothetical protein